MSLSVVNVFFVRLPYVGIIYKKQKVQHGVGHKTHILIVGHFFEVKHRIEPQCTVCWFVVLAVPVEEDTCHGFRGISWYFTMVYKFQNTMAFYCGIRWYAFIRLNQNYISVTINVDGLLQQSQKNTTHCEYFHEITLSLHILAVFLMDIGLQIASKC